MCKIDGLEGTENLVVIRLLFSEDIGEEREGGGQNTANLSVAG